MIMSLLQSVRKNMAQSLPRSAESDSKKSGESRSDPPEVIDLELDGTAPVWKHFKKSAERVLS